MIRTGLVVATLSLAVLAGCASGDGAKTTVGTNGDAPVALVCRHGGMPTCIENLGRRTQCFCADEQAMRDLLERKPR